jgi:hypothetical protein
MQHVFAQAPPRPKSREIQLPWDIKKPVQEEFVSQGERVPVPLHEVKGLQEPDRIKAYLPPKSDESWEWIAESRFGFTVEIDPKVNEIRAGDIVECQAIYTDPSTAKKSVFRVPPKVPKCFAVGMEIKMEVQVAKITVPNIAAATSIEDIISLS